MTYSELLYKLEEANTLLNLLLKSDNPCSTDLITPTRNRIKTLEAKKFDLMVESYTETATRFIEEGKLDEANEILKGIDKLKREHEGVKQV